MKQVIILLFLSSIFLSCKAQESFYNHLQFGNHRIGFCDTVIYDTAIKYEQYGYEGSKPIYCKIWFPIENADCV